MRGPVLRLLFVALALGTSLPRAAVPGTPLDLAALLAEAEASNPEIQAASARVEGLRHLPSQMQALPDPTASVSYTNETLTDFTLGSAPDSELTFSWIQEVPYPGKRRLAGDVARAEIEVGSRGLDSVRLRVHAAVKAAYTDLLRVDRTVSILEESRKLLEAFREAARARYESGEGILENVLKAQTELTRIDVDLAGLAQERRSAEAALNSLLGRSADTALGPAVSVPRVRTPDREAAEKAALDGSPELRGLHAAVERDERRVDLARRNLKPDLMWGAAYTNRGSLDPMVMGMFGIRLPLYRENKQRQAVAQDEYELRATQRDLDAGSNALLAEVRDLLARADRAEAQMRLTGEGTLPLARSALDAASAAYSAGQTEFVTVIEDFRTVLGFEIDYENQRTEMIRALVALEPLTGQAFVEPGPDVDAQGDAHE